MSYSCPFVSIRGHLKRLPYREEKLKMARLLHHRRAEARIHVARSRVGITLQELLHRALESVEAGRIDAVRKIQAKRPYRRFITDAETGGVNHVIEVLKIPLARTKRDVVDAAVDVPHVMEEDAADVFAQQREPQLGLMEE